MCQEEEDKKICVKGGEKDVCRHIYNNMAMGWCFTQHLSAQTLIVPACHCRVFIKISLIFYAAAKFNYK